MNHTNICILDCEYFACIDWYQKYISTPNVLIEQYEHFERKSFRNRCEVAGPNGKITLSIPLERGRNQRTIMKDVKVCNDEKWLLLHWKTICTSYRRSPFFEYYEEQLQSFFEKDFTYLMDVNLHSLELINALLKQVNTYQLSEKYQKELEIDTYDGRKSFLPQNDTTNHSLKYIQIFEERNSFMPNLSILDMVFSCGNQTNKLLSTL